MGIENRNLEPGTWLVARYFKQHYVCQVIEGQGGKPGYRLEDGRVFKSLSAAGTAITRKSCNGWAFWSVDTAQTGASPETEPVVAQQESAIQTVETTETPEIDTGEEEKEGEPQPAAGDVQEQVTAKKVLLRLPNQKNVAEGQTRWYCFECRQHFLRPTGTIPRECPRGHRAS
ncbi:MAG: hypothetical protein NTU41_05740 [Chloroflexi bacterium]|nr:hypothetical protein [Chloroflexota bacterium]